MTVHYDTPDDVARRVAERPRPLLIGLDVDGVLAPIVNHAAEAELTDGVASAVSSIAACDGVSVAVVSGRSVDDLARFEFGADIALVGSHGLESRDRPLDPLDESERSRIAHLRRLVGQALDTAGDGAWIESKPASVALHVREADAARGERALHELAAEAATIDGTVIKAGSAVLELFARWADKGSAMTRLRDELGASTVVFVGDDITDEDAFGALRHRDVSIKVGPADTIADLRLRDPDGVLVWLRHLADLL